MSSAITNRTSAHPDRPIGDPRSESGIALLAVMMAGLVIISMGVLAFQLSDTALTQSTRQIRREQLVHLAEHGIDQTLARLADNQNYTAYDVSALGAYPGPFATSNEEKVWVKAAFADPDFPAGQMGTTPQGEYAFMKPAGANVVYAASWIPSRAAAAGSPRILKVEYLLSSYSPASAIVTGGNLAISGSPTLTGSGGTAHTNGDIAVSGNPNTQGMTASGTATVSGSPTPPPVGGQPPQPTLKINPRTVYEQRFSSGVTANWYDLCADGSVHAPAASGSEPCTGTLLEPDATSVPFRGWTLSGDTWTFSSNDSSYSGVYYVHLKSAKVSGNPGTAASPWSATILAQASETAASDPPGCPHGFGDIEISGSPTITPLLEGLGLMAGRDLVISGNPTLPVPTLLASHEQIKISGTPTLNGAFVAEDACNTPSSPVATNIISGNPAITLNGDLEVTLPAAVRTALWIEL